MSDTGHRPATRAARIGFLLGALAALPYAKDGFAQTTAAPPVQTTPAPVADSAAADSSQINEVVVTGTRIRGVAPVGSPLITLDQATIKETGLMSTNDVLDSIPSVLSLANGNNIAAGTQVQNGFSGTYGNSPNIHGLGPQATLSLVNGHRMFDEGIVSNAFDPNNYPVQMLSRIEVVQDGTSPIYGADAVAGTVNYVLRNPVNTIETYAGSHWSHGQNGWFATGIFGHTWGEAGSHSGGFIASYQHTQDGSLWATDYPSLYNDNFSRYGGTQSPTFASPGNVLIGGSTYAIPAGQNGQSLTLSQLGAAGSANRQNSWVGIQAIPVQSADHYSVNFNQQITDSIQFFGDGLLTDRNFSRYSTTASNNLAPAVPNTNPYSPCNPGHYANGIVTGPANLVAACNTGSLQINYSDVSESGARHNYGISRLWAGTGGVHFSLPGDWKLTTEVTFAEHLQEAGTSTISAANAGTFNFFCDDSVYQCNPPGSVHQIPWVTDANVSGPILETFHYYQMNADGALLKLPGGSVRLAVGVEYDGLSHEQHNGTDYTVTRNSKSAYAELYVPIVGSANSIPGIARLELDIAARTDDYSDTGRTTNPKIGINWSPVEDLKVHGSYGKSFHPAPLMDLGSLNPIWNSQPLAAAAVSPAICPQCTNPALFGPNGANKLVYDEAMGANSGLVPETSKSYSLGLDWAPKAIPKFTASVNYWWIHYINEVANPQNSAGFSGAINQQFYNDHIIYNPTFFPALALNNPLAYFEPFPHANVSDPNCAAVVGKKIVTQALYNQFVQCASDSSGGPARSGGQTLNGQVAGSPNDVLAFEYFGQQNAGSTRADGIDLALNYGLDNLLGAWKFGVIGEYVRSFEVSVIPGAPVIDEANRFGYPLSFKGRGQIGWSRENSVGELSASLFANYSSAYRMDLNLLPPGVPASYADIKHSTTYDLTLVYNTHEVFNSWLGKDISISLSAQNLFNSRPPLVIDPAGGGGPGLLFDPAHGFPLSRIVQLQVGKNW